MLTVVERVGDRFEERRDTRCRFVPLVRDAGPEERRRVVYDGGRAEAPHPEEAFEVRSVEAQVSGVVQGAVSYTHLRAHETVLDLVCRLRLENKKNTPTTHAS